MKTLTLTQPWATLVAIGAKRIETRSWQTHYRGPLAIHAARTYTPGVVRLAMIEPFKSVLAAAGYRLFSQLPRGDIIAICSVVACLQIKSEPCTFDLSRGEHVALPPAPPELCFGDFTPGRFAWVLVDVQELPTPVPARGALGLWESAL